MKMITKELCRKMYNCYHDIDLAKKLIEDCEKSIKERKPAIETDCFGYEQNFHMSLPSNYENSRTTVKVNPHLALAVMRNHIAEKEAELTALNEQVILIYNEVSTL